MVEAIITATNGADVASEIEAMWENANEEVRKEIMNGQVLIDATRMLPETVGVAIACFYGLTGVFPYIQDCELEEITGEQDIPIDLQEYADDFYLKYKKSGGKDKKK